MFSSQQRSWFTPKVTVVFWSNPESFFLVGSTILVLLYPPFSLLFVNFLIILCKSHSLHTSNMKYFSQDRLVLKIFQKTLWHKVAYVICSRWHRKTQGHDMNWCFLSTWREVYVEGGVLSKKPTQTPATLKKAFVQLIYKHISKTMKQTKEQNQNTKS